MAGRLKYRKFLSKIVTFAVIFAASLAVHCSPVPRAVSVNLPMLPPASLGDVVRDLIRPECGSCHTASLPTAKAAALEVFDLDKETWSASMSVEQLESFGRRLRRNSNDTLRARAAAFVAEQIEQRERDLPADHGVRQKN